MEQANPKVTSMKHSLNVTALHPAWAKLILMCQRMGQGEIERVKIQNGIPVLVEKTVERIKLT